MALAKPRTLLVVVLFTTLFALAWQFSLLDTDSWWHLTAGQITLDTGRSLQVDVFSHTRAGAPWVNHGWLAQALMAAAHRLAGLAGVRALSALLITAAAVLVYAQMDGSPYLRAFLVLLAALVSAPSWLARPQLFSLPLLAAVGLVARRFRRRLERPFALVALPPLFALWANLHGGYALGFMLLVAVFIGTLWETRRTRDLRPVALLAAAGMLSALALALSPHGARMWTYYLDTVGVKFLRQFIQEWRSPDFHSRASLPLLLLILGALGLLARSKRRMSAGDTAALLVFTLAALMARRNAGPLAIVAAPILSRCLAPAAPPHPAPPPKRSLAILNGALLLIWVALLAAWLILAPQPMTLHALPQESVAYVEQAQPQGRMFNTYAWGGYLIWRLWPDYRVYVDGRTDLYGDEFLSAYLDAYQGRDLTPLDAVDWALIEAGSGLDVALGCAPAWAETHRDPVAVVYQRVAISGRRPPARPATAATGD
jgi:hypothetical protein